MTGFVRYYKAETCPGKWGKKKRIKVHIDLFLFLVKVCGLRTFATEEDPEAREVCVEIIFSHLSLHISYSVLTPQTSPNHQVGSLTVGGRLPPLEHELVVSRQPAVSAAAPQQATAISSPYMHLSECFTGGHPPPPLQGMLPLFKKFSSSNQQRNNTFTTLQRCSSASPSCSCCASFISAFSRLSGTLSKLSGSSEPNIQFTTTANT